MYMVMRYFHKRKSLFNAEQDGVAVYTGSFSNDALQWLFFRRLVRAKRPRHLPRKIIAASRLIYSSL
jgi:hypothetical protein